MKKFFAIMVASVMVLALALSATAMYSLDRIFVNENDRVAGDAQFGAAGPDGSDIEIEVGDSLYIIGWAVNTDTGAGLDKIVYTIDDGDDIDCEGGYRDRPDVAQAFGLDASAGVGAGFGYDNATDGGMMKLAGIEDLPDGTYEIAIKAIYTDGTEQVMEGPTGNIGVFTLIVGTGEPADESSEEASDESSDEEPGEESSDEEPGEESSDEEPGEESSDEEPIDESSEEEGGEPVVREFGEIEEGKLNIVIDGGLGRYEAKAGDEIEVKIELKNNTTISSLKVTLTLDAKLSVLLKGNGKPEVKFNLKPTDEEATVLTDSNYNAETNTLIMNWATPDGEVTSDATFATIKIKVADDAEIGDFLPITADINPNNVFDMDMNNIDFHQIDGGVDVIGEEVDESSEEVEESSEDVEESSEEVEESSEEASSEEQTDDESKGEGEDNPKTADVAIIAVASVAAVALAGAVIGKKALKK